MLQIQVENEKYYDRIMEKKKTRSDQIRSDRNVPLPETIQDILERRD